MTEQVNVSSESVSQNQNVAPSQNVQNSVSAPTPKLYTDDDVNKIVGDKKQKAYEQGRQETLAELQKQQTVSQSTTNSTVNAASQPQLTQEQLAAIRKEVVGDVQKEMQTQQLVSQFALKMTAGQQKYSDFEKVVTPLQLQTIPHVVQLANGFENTADIMYDLGRNPTKVSNLMVLAQINPQLAYQEMQNLSDSIKKNETALANQKDVREPLSQKNSSNVGVDNGSRTIAERRRDPRYKV